MVGVEFVWTLYQNSGPALMVVIILGGGYIWKRDIQPRLSNLEGTQEARADKWEEQQLNAQERTLLLDDAHDRVDQVESAAERLQKRLRALEQAYAAEHGSMPTGDVGPVESGGDD